MNATYRNAVADHGGTLITHIGLVDETGTEITGGDPAYARQAVSWTTATDGTIRPDADLEFNIPASTTVGGWKGFSALTGGTDYDGEDVDNESFTNQGTYTLEASQTAIHHAEPAA
jgi:hypothetical protein